MLKFANESMNELAKKKKAPLQLLHYRTCKKERTNVGTNDFTVRLQCRRKERIHTCTHCLLSRFEVSSCVWESQSQVYSYNNDACAASSGSGSSSSDTLCSRRALKVNWVWIRRQAPRQRRLRRRLWLNLLDEQLSAEQRRGSAACNSLAFNCLGVASHDHYLSAAQLHYEQRVCVSEWESAIALQRADDKFVIRKISRWALNYLICLMKMPRANAELCTRSPLLSLSLPLSVHQLSDRRRFKVLFIVYILSLTFLGNIFIYLFVSQYLRAIHLNEFTSARERER